MLSTHINFHTYGTIMALLKGTAMLGKGIGKDMAFTELSSF